jgi:hypothetical protein
MSPARLSFFDKLDAELSKIEPFFIEKEGEARKRSEQLREQLEELKDHRRLFHVTGSFALYCMLRTERYLRRRMLTRRLKPQCLFLLFRSLGRTSQSG